MYGERKSTLSPGCVHDATAIVNSVNVHVCFTNIHVIWSTLDYIVHVVVHTHAPYTNSDSEQSQVFPFLTTGNIIIIMIKIW